MLTLQSASMHLENAICFVEFGKYTAASRSASHALAALHKKQRIAPVDLSVSCVRRDRMPDEIAGRLQGAAAAVAGGDIAIAIRNTLAAVQLLNSDAVGSGRPN